MKLLLGSPACGGPGSAARPSRGYVCTSNGNAGAGGQPPVRRRRVSDPLLWGVGVREGKPEENEGWPKSLPTQKKKTNLSPLKQGGSLHHHLDIPFSRTYLASPVSGVGPTFIIRGVGFGAEKVIS